jgi:hypothetical protein
MIYSSSSPSSEASVTTILFLTAFGLVCIPTFFLSAPIVVYASHDFTFINQCSEPVWVGALGAPGKQVPRDGGWRQDPGTSSTVAIQDAWSGRIWARTGCTFDIAGKGICATGDCGGNLECRGQGGATPATLAEFTLNAGPSNLDFYDVSFVDGGNINIGITPVPGSYIRKYSDQPDPYYCGAPSCSINILDICPPELQLKHPTTGDIIACKSACEAFNTDAYCCRGAHNTPATCLSSSWPTDYPKIFKTACPSFYSYAYDDRSSTFICRGAPHSAYNITFQC